MKINKQCFSSGAFGAVCSLVSLFGLYSCGSGIKTIFENSGKHIVCIEAIEKRVYNQLESCK